MSPPQVEQASAEHWSVSAPDLAWQLDVPVGTEVSCSDSHAELHFPGRLHVLMSTSRGADHGAVGELQDALEVLSAGYVERLAEGLPPQAVRVRDLRLGRPSRAARVVEIRPASGPVHVAVLTALPLPLGHVVQVASWTLPAEEYAARRDFVWDLLVDVAASWSSEATARAMR